MQRSGATLAMVPVLPEQWPGFSLRYRFGAALYVIEVEQVSGNVASLHVDGVLQEGQVLNLLDDGREHQVRLVCCRPASAPSAQPV